MSHPIRGFLLLVSSLVVGCATSFTGSAYYPGGPGACFATCSQQRMQMSGFVYLGEYSSACVCAPAGPGTAANDSRSAGNGAAGAGGVVGVVLQARAAEAARANH